MAGQIVKRSENSYTVRIFMGRDPNTGKRKYQNRTVRGNKKDAQRVLNALLRQQDMGELMLEPVRMTVQEYLDHWLEVAAKPRLRQNTFEKYRDMMVRYVYPDYGTIKLPKFSPVHIQELYTKLQVDRGLAPRTVRYCHSVLNSALGQAVKWRMVTTNSAQHVDLPKQQKKEMLALSDKEAQRFLEIAKVESIHYVLFATLLGTGLRPSEAFGLQWSDIDFIRRALRVQRVVSIASNGWSFKPPKTNKSRRSVALPDHLIQLLLEHREMQEPSHLDLVFPNGSGNPLNISNIIYRDFKPIAKKAGLPKRLRLYDLRHTHATLLLMAGVHPKIVSERLGHSTITLTMDTYSHVLPGMQEESAQKLDALLFNADENSVEPVYN